MALIKITKMKNEANPLYNLSNALLYNKNCNHAKEHPGSIRKILYRMQSHSTKMSFPRKHIIEGSTTNKLVSFCIQVSV